MSEQPNKSHGSNVQAVDYPIARLFIVLVTYVICLFVMSKYGYSVLLLLTEKAGVKWSSSYAASAFLLLIVLLVLLIVCALIGQARVFFRKGKGFWYGLFVGGYMLLFAAYAAIESLSEAVEFESKETILFSVLYFILVGITEELVFRGVIADLTLKYLLQKESKKEYISIAVITSSALFALFHVFNIHFALYSGVLIQMIGVFVLGMYLTAVYYRSGNLYAVMFLHIINDIVAAIPVTIIKSKESVADVISEYGFADLIQLIPFLIVIMVILRPVKKEEIKEMWLR